MVIYVYQRVNGSYDERQKMPLRGSSQGYFKQAACFEAASLKQPAWSSLVNTPLDLYEIELQKTCRISYKKQIRSNMSPAAEGPEQEKRPVN